MSAQLLLDVDEALYDELGDLADTHTHGDVAAMAVRVLRRALQPERAAELEAAELAAAGAKRT